MHEKKEILTSLDPWAGVYCTVFPCPASSAFCHRYSGALDDGTREGGEPILLGDEACLVPLSSN